MNKVTILINPLSPTIIYIILDIVSLKSSNKKPTKLKSNNPINPQLSAPTIVKTRHDFCNEVPDGGDEPGRYTRGREEGLLAVCG